MIPIICIIIVALFSHKIAVIGTLGFSVCIGVYYAFVGKQTKDEMLVGGRNMKPLPIA